MADLGNKISVCIPTYNRAKYLKDLMHNILYHAKGASCGIEIVVCDNASQDKTQDVVESFMAEYDNIKYFKWKKNVGADFNYLKTIEIATGEYCWLMGSDDGLVKDALKEMLIRIESGCEIYVCDEFYCDVKLSPYHKHIILKGVQDGRMFDFNKRDDVVTYLSCAMSHTALLGYLSCIIVKRQSWLDSLSQNIPIGSLYAHTYILYNLLKRGGTVCYVNKPLVLWRGGNDSFGGRGRIEKRYMIDFKGFQMLSNVYLGSDPELKELFLKVFRRHHPIKNIAYLRLNVNSTKRWLQISKILVHDFGYSKIWILVLWPSIVKIPLWGILMLKRCFFIFKKTIDLEASSC